MWTRRPMCDACLLRSQTALHKAAWNRRQEVCSMLVAAGALLTKTDHQVYHIGCHKTGCTFIITVARTRRISCCLCLFRMMCSFSYLSTTRSASASSASVYSKPELQPQTT